MSMPPSRSVAIAALGGVALGRAGLAERHQVHGERRQRPRPGDAVLVGELLDRGRDDARRADPVGAHPDRLLVALLVEVAGAERL